MVIHVTSTGDLSAPSVGSIKRVVITVTSGAGLISITDEGALDFTVRCSEATNEIEICYPYTGTLNVGTLSGTGAEAWIELGV